MALLVVVLGRAGGISVRNSEVVVSREYLPTFILAILLLVINLVLLSLYVECWCVCVCVGG